MKRRTFLQYAAASAVGANFLLSQAASAKSVAPFDTIWGPPVLPVALLGIIAQQGKVKDKYPFQVKVWQTPDILRAGIANNSMALTIVPSYVAANFYNQGKDVALVNIMTKGLLHIVGRGAKLNSLTDLVGKSIVVPFKNDMPDLLLQVLLRKHKIKPADINIAYTSTPLEAVGFFLQKKYDYALLPEPLVSGVQLKGKLRLQSIDRVLDMQQEWGRVMRTAPVIAQAGLMINKKLLKGHQQVVAELQQDLVAAVAFSKTNPADTAAIGAKYLPFPSPALSRALPFANLSAEPAAEQQENLALLFAALAEINPKIIGGKVPDSNLYKF